MLKLAVIVILLLLGGLAVKYLDEKTQHKVVLVFGTIIVVLVVILMASELMRH